MQTARDIMTGCNHGKKETTIRELAELFTTRRRAYPVVDNDGNLIGIVSSRILLSRTRIFTSRR
jgi:CBS domain-containing protein